MSGFEGFFVLECHADLLKKLRHDMARVRQNPVDAYAAFDFFVTAEHLLDWKYPDVGGKDNICTKSTLRKTKPLLRVTSHLANGAKHFKTKDKRHASVDDAHVHIGAFDSAAFDLAAFDANQFVVNLAEEDAKVLGSEISVLKLAEAVLDYWEHNQ